VILTESEVRRSLKRAKAAFPRFSDWDYSNEVNDSYSGFSLWGEWVSEPDEPDPRSFFVTFDTDQATWAGHLSVGKPCYYWSSADCGDANLFDTDPCGTLEDAITSLKRRMVDLFTALLGSADEAGAAPGRGGRQRPGA
jgi:hypothetical protein